MRVHHRAVCALGTKPTLASALIPMAKARLSISTSSAGAPPAGARCCRGRAHLCAKRNDGVLPKPVRDFFLSFLAAQYAGLGFEDFRDAMEGRAETKAFFAWRKACAGCRR